MGSFKVKSHRRAQRKLASRSGLLGLITLMVLGLVTSVIAVVAVTGTSRDERIPFDVSGKRIETAADELPPMEKPAGAKGVELNVPKGPKAEAPKKDDSKPKKSCKDNPSGSDGSRTSETPDLVDAAPASDETCVFEETSQSDKLRDAAPFDVAKDAKRAPAPQPAPQDADGGADAGTDADADPSTDADGDADSEDPSTEDPDVSDDSPGPADEDSDDAGSESDEGAGKDGAGGGGSGGVSDSGRARVAPAVAKAASASRDEASISDRVATRGAPADGEYLAPNWGLAHTQGGPSARRGAAIAYDPVRDQVVMFGGTTSAGLTDETWVWNGTAWAPVTLTVKPTARQRAAIAWDPVLQKIVMFGGQTGASTYSNQAWSWNGTAWTLMTPTGTAPVGRAGASMAFDNSRSGLIIFGGVGAATYNDTWQLKNNAWTTVQANGASGAPPVRFDAAMAYSVSTSQVVLFGGGHGCAPTCSTRGDTWTLESGASTWTQKSPTHAPPARGNAGMAYDATLGLGPGAVVMHGGISYSPSATYLNDTWAWTGQDWVQAVGIASPPARAGAAMAADSDGQMVLFGGTIGATLTAETWTYDTTMPILDIDVTRASDEPLEDETFWVGDTIKVSVTAANAGVAITAGDQISIVAALQSTLLSVGTEIKWGTSDVPVCSGGLLALCGGVQDLSTAISNIAIPAGGTTVGEFLATVAGSQKGCELVDIPAVASSLLGSSPEVSKRITVCGGGLGLEDWWTYDSTDLGGGGTASVNAANGNLVVKQYDTDPIQTPGRLAIGLGRVYNSQDLMSGGGPLGAGWQFDIGDTGETAGGFGLLGLKLPNLQTVLQPLSMPYVDRDGTRHTFKLRSVGASLGNLSLPIDLTGQENILDSILGLLNLQTLPFTLTSAVNGLTYSNLCLDQAYSGPPGSNMFLFRYIGMGSNNCTNPAEGGRLTVGWSLIRPDRVRYDFNAAGDLIRVTDPAGEQLVYTPGVAYGPTEIRTSSCESGTACPKVTINYDAGGAGSNRHVKVTDTAGRVTSYIVSRSLTLPLLLQVWEPGNPLSDATGAVPSSAYTYATAGNPCAGSVDGTVTSGQLCSVKDANEKTTTFSYVEAPIGPDRISTVKDRRANDTNGLDEGLATKYTWSDPTGNAAPTGPFMVTADMAAPNTLASCGTTCHRIRYSDIDAYGRVGQIAEGTTGGTDGAGIFYSQAGYLWDGSEATGGIATCAQPTVKMNHNLCQVIRRAVPSNANFTRDTAGTGTVSGVTVHDQAVDYLYGDFGQRLRQRVLLDASQPWTDANSAITTWGSHEQYFDAGNGQRFFNNHVRGSGVVHPTPAGGTYRQTVTQDNPLAFWRLDEASGTTMNSTTGTNTGAYAAGTQLGQPGVVHGNTSIGESTSGWGGAIPGLTGFAQGTTPGDSDFTVETWMKTASTGAEYAFQWGSPSAYASVGRLNGGFPFVTLISDVATSKAATVYTTTPVADNEWHHVVYRYTGSGNAAGIEIWIDGQKAPVVVYNDTLNGPFAGPSPTTLFGVSAGASSLDELAIYDSALSGGRIAAHHTAALGATRVKADTLYAVVDEVQELSPRGNAAGNADKWGEYLTSIRRDIPADGVLASTNKTAGATVCGNAPQGNTGLICAVDTPAAAGVNKGSCTSPTSNLPAGSPLAPTPSSSYASSCTKYEYNNRGQRTVMRTPKATSTSSSRAFRYEYYPVVSTCAGENRNACDLSGTVSAGGWLKAVVDPTDPGEKVVYAYDAAGNVARTWDRNASQGKDLTATWANPNAPPSTKFTDTVAANPVTSDAISVSNTALVAIAPDGTVTGAGTNASGELGDGTTNPQPTAVPANPLTNVVQVSQSATGAFSGCSFTLFLTGSGQVWVTGAGAATAYKATALPKNIISIAAGGCHALALDAEGGLWSWGTNNSGQVGNGTSTNVSVHSPVKVLDNVSTMSAGYIHSLAVTTDGKSWSWGGNNVGQLGLGDTSGRTTPTEITALSDAGIRQVSGGFGSSYAIGRNGTAWAFGGNAYSELGDGTTTQRTSPVKITAIGPGTTAGPVRQIVGAAHGAGALMADGKVRIWGLNNAAQAGGATNDSTMPTPVQVPDLSKQVAIAGGWATYATADQAGTIKVWGATGNNQRADNTNPASTSTPTPAGFDISPYRSPLWGPQGTRDATGNLVTTTRDRLGQAKRTRTGRGHDINTSAYDRMVGYDAAGRQAWTTGAQHRSSSSTIRTTYDPFGNPVKNVDARGVASRSTFDALNRRVTSQVTRGVAGVSPASCSGTAATAQWTAGQDGHKICTTTATYDGVGRQVALSDANAQVTRTYFDAANRRIRVEAPRNHGDYTTVTARWVYDRDGNMTDACSPRQFDTSESNSTSTCTADGVHSKHLSYDTSGNVTAETRYRAGDGQPEALVTAYTYDADRNPVEVTDANGHKTTAEYDLQGRRLSQTVPRTSTKQYTTRWSYDPNGNVTAVRAPGSINIGSGSNGDLVIDGTTASGSTDGIVHGAANPFQVPDGAQYRNVTLKNGAHITAAVANGLSFHATGTVTVCSTCVVSMAGKGYQGGAAGTGADNGNGSDAANPNPGNGGKGGSGGALALSPSGGGGGGHKNDGGPAGAAGAGPGLPGKASGTSDFATVGTDYLRGSGGGGGGGGKNLLGAAGAGGNGGGFVRITALKIVINGRVDASGVNGAAGDPSSGGGGGGAGGGIWLAAPDIDLASASALDVTGGAGGANTQDRQGGNGSPGYIRLDADTVTNEPPGADRTRAATVTAISYDAVNRPLDVIEGAQTFQADPTVNSGEFAVPDPHGLSNTRTRSIYNADGQVTAVLPPQAFSNAASLTDPKTSTARRTDFDLDGLPTASYEPRYDNASGSTVTSVGSGNDGGGTTNQQTAQCATGRVVDQAAGPSNTTGAYSVLPAAYGAQVGVCVARTTYDPVGNVKRAYLPTSSGSDNGYLEYAYTGDGLAATMTGPDPNSSGRVTTASMRYDGVGRLTWTQDANLNVEQTAYTADGLVRQQIAQTYDPDGSGPLAAINEVSNFDYDATGNLVENVNPKGDATTQTWTSDNLLAQITAPGPGTGTGQLTAVTRYGYDAVGNTTQVWQPQAVQDGKRPVRNEFTHDNLIAATHSPLTDNSYRSVRYAYSPAGRKVATETARCTSADFTVCTPGNSNFLSAGVVKLTYGANGRPASQVGRDRTPNEGSNSSITTTYAQHGGPAQIIDPTSGTTIDVGYYLDGKARRVVDNAAAGNTNTYAYNGAGSLTVRTDKTSASGPTADATISTSFRYNHAGLPGGTYSDVLDATTDYTFDDGGRITAAQTGAHVAEWSWHPNDALAGAKTTANGTVLGEFLYRYDANRNITRQAVSGSGGTYTNEYSYAPGQQVTGWTYSPSGGTAKTTTYGYDKNNNRTSLVENIAGVSTTTTTSYHQDNSINAVNAPGTSADFTYIYDRAGRLTDDGCNDITYDPFDRIEKQVAKSAPAAVCRTDGRTTEYTYDGLDRQRAVKVTNSSKTGANRTTRSVYDGLTTDLVGQTDAVNGTRNGPTVLYQLDSSGTPVAYDQTGPTGAGKAFLDHDGHGNIATVSSGSHALVCAARYDPFGNPNDPPATGSPNGVCNASGGPAEATGNAVWYRGQVRDGSTGNYQLGTRTYDPAKAAFTTPDQYRVSSPATDLGVGTDPLTMNTYTYVNGNPVNRMDPDGHMLIDAGGGGGGASKSSKPKSTSNWQAIYRAELTGKGSRRVNTPNYLTSDDPTSKMFRHLEANRILDQAASARRRQPDRRNWLERNLTSKISLPSVSCLMPRVGAGGAMCDTDGTTATVGEFLTSGASMLKMLFVPDVGACYGSRATPAACALEVAGTAPTPFKALKLKRLDELVEAKPRAADGADNGARVTTNACRTNSFTGTTIVLMADGTRKPIRDVKFGDEVRATDPKTGESGPRKVVDLIRHSGPHTMVAVRLLGGSTIDATDRHPFWVENQWAWVDAIDLQPGDVLVTADGSRRTVSSTDISEQHLTAYNLTVAGLHTYFAGGDSVLVHNTGCTNIADLPPSAVRNLTEDANYAFSRLSQNHGVTRIEFREQIHQIKRNENLPADFNLSFGPTGDVWNPRTGELIGGIVHGG